MPDLTTDASSADWAQIRYDYEHSSRPIVDICAEHGISPNTLRDRVRRWRWNRRRAPIPREGPPAVAAPQSDTAVAPLPPVQALGTCAMRARTVDVDSARAANLALPSPLWGGVQSEPAPPVALEPDAGDPASIAPRLQVAVARVLPAIETIIARLSAGPLAPREMEQTARALGALTHPARTQRALGSASRAGRGRRGSHPRGHRRVSP